MQHAGGRASRLDRRARRRAQHRDGDRHRVLETGRRLKKLEKFTVVVLEDHAEGSRGECRLDGMNERVQALADQLLLLTGRQRGERGGGEITAEATWRKARWRG